MGMSRRALPQRHSPFILDPRQEIRPRLSGGNHKFSNARLKAGSLTNR